LREPLSVVVFSGLTISERGSFFITYWVMQQTNIKAIKSTLIKLFRKTMNYSGLILVFMYFLKNKHTNRTPHKRVLKIIQLLHS